MKRTLVLTLTALLCTAAIAEEMTVPQRIGNKAVRGAIDLVTGIVELPMQIVKGYNKGCDPIKNEPTSKAVGTILGFFRGVGHTAGRMGHGGRELFACWTADQPSNDGIGVPFDAVRSWEQGEQYSILKPTLKEGVTPIGRKLKMGLANTFTGIVEVPKQIMKAKENETSVAKGAGKGVYNFFSRTIYGATDVFTLFFLVPNQVETFGLPYDGLYPWSDGEE
jgi:putative exosortase-associated protein (TIGR04073 family)